MKTNLATNYKVSVAAAMVLTTGALRAQTPEDVDMAIKLGQSGKASQLLSRCLATPSFAQSVFGVSSGPTPIGNYDVYLGTNIGRIAALAQEAKKTYKPFAKEDIAADLLDPSVYVWIEPNDPKKLDDNNVKVASPLKHLVLKSKSREEAVIQPDKLETIPVEWEVIVGVRAGAGAVGGITKVPGTKALARFSINAVRALPPGDFDVVLITEAGERRCKVGQGDRKKLGLIGAPATAPSGN